MGRTNLPKARRQLTYPRLLAAALLGTLLLPSGSLAFPGEGSSPVEDPTLPALDHTVDRSLRSSSVLAARLAIERSLIATEDSRTFDRTTSRLQALRASAAAHLAHTLPHEVTASTLIHQVFDSLRIRHIRAMRGGHNALLNEVLSQRRLHPGATDGPRAFWVDCDLLAITAWAVLEELQERRPLDLLTRVAVVSTSDHVALAVRGDDPSDEASLQVVLLEVLDADGRIEIELVPYPRYRNSYRRRFGETPRVLAPQVGLVANSWEIAANHLIANGNYGRAEEYASRALALDPDSPGAWNSISIAQRRDAKPTAALESLSRAIALRGRDAHLFANLASVHLALGDHERARRAVESAVAYGPREPLVYKRRFAVLTHLGQLADARRDLATYQTLLGNRVTATP